jgi:hypothetical protein
MDAFDFVNDPIAAEQVALLGKLLHEEWSDRARDGFLVTAGRFVDAMGFDRTAELASVFKTNLPSGRKALRQSLEALFAFVGSLHQFEADYPVLINDPHIGSLGVFPQLPILGIRHIAPKLYRALHSAATVKATGEPLRDFIMREGCLPFLQPPVGLVLRKKPRMHWCSYEAYESPSITRDALQILPKWNSDCKLRATLSTSALEGLAFVAFNGDTEYEDGQPGAFAGYFVEIKAQDHDELPGGGLQVGVVGNPAVLALEEWNDTENQWNSIWYKSTH